VRIHNEITVAAPADELFAFLSDVERVAPCLPGAAVEGRDGDDYAGRMKVKVGPINATYAGKLRFVELDRDARRAVMRARAEEVNGQGNAEAHITTQVEGDGDESTIRMDTDLQMRGKVAQFGRGAMEKISQRMFEQFARNIEQAVAGDAAAPAPEAEAAAPPAERREAPARAEASLDVLSTFGGPALQRAVPLVATAALALAYGVLLGHVRADALVGVELGVEVEGIERVQRAGRGGRRGAHSSRSSLRLRARASRRRPSSTP
jgi:carbon monoxide dehydrogenase subunit G